MISRAAQTVGPLPVLVATVFLMAFVVAACGNSVPSPPFEAEPPPTITTAPVVTTFESSQYAYTMSTFEGTLLGPWHGAERAWDGTQRIDTAGPNVDRTTVADGDLYLVGGPAPDGLAGFLARFERSVGAVQGCTEGARFKNGIGPGIGLVPSKTAVPKALLVVGIASRERCAGNTLFARQVLVHAGYGIGAWIASVPSDDDEKVLINLVEMLAGLGWSTG